MGGQIFDFIAALFFMSGLILIFRLRQNMIAEDETGYRYISGGLSVLAGVSLLRIYGGLDLFEGIPFLADRLFFQIIVWIAVMSGLVLLLSGISTWLPLSRSQRKYNKQRLKMVELTRKVAQLVRVDSRLPVIMAKTLDYMVSDFEFAHGALYLCSRKGRRMLLASTSGHAAVAHSLLESADFQLPPSVHSIADESAVMRKAAKLLPPGLANPQIIQPIFSGNQLAGLFLLWDSSSEADEDDLRVNIKSAAGIIGLRVKLDQTRLRQENQVKIDQCQESLSEILHLHTPLEENLPRIKNLLKKVMPVDMLSLTIRTENGKTQRYSVGENGTVLNEIGVATNLSPDLKDLTDQVLHPVIVNDIANEREVPIDDLICSSRMGSMAVLTLAAGDTVEGTCAVASLDKNQYSAIEAHSLTGLSPLLKALLSEEKHRRSRVTSLRRTQHLREFHTLANRSGDRAELYDRAAVILSDEIKPSLVRISTFDTDGAFLTSYSLLLNRSAENITPARGHMILSLLPLHQQVRDSGETVIVDHFRGLNCMTKIETAQALLPDSEFAVLIPIKDNGIVTGLIGMSRKGKTRHEMFTPEDLEFATGLATVLSEHSPTAAHVNTEPGRMTSGMLTEGRPDPDYELRNRLKSSLTGIIGSLELIKSTGQHDEKVKRYLEIIDKSAHRMSRYCQEDATV